MITKPAVLEFPVIPGIDKIVGQIDTRIPFCGGLLGYVGYENNYRFGLYDSVLVIDHQKNRSLLASWKLSTTELKTEADRWMHLLESTPIRDEETGGTGKIHFPWSFDRYREKIQKIKDYLIAGDVYQINLTGCFETETEQSASLIYRRLRKISPAPYSAFLNTGDMQILSASPECFFQID